MMATEVTIPKLGFAMNEGTLQEWSLEDGAAVKAGEILFLLESDKSTNEIEAPADGTLRILKPAGEVYQVGTVIGMIE